MQDNQPKYKMNNENDNQSIVSIDKVTVTAKYNDIEQLEYIKSLQKPYSPFVLLKWLQILLQMIRYHYNILDNSNPKRAKLIQKFTLFFLVSFLVTLVQYLLIAILPDIQAFRNLSSVEFMWPKVPLYQYNGNQYYWSIIGYSIASTSNGVASGGGLGFFLVVQISILVAQIINFPLQRNLVFKSKGNIFIQIFAYFIGYIFVSVFLNSINNLWLPWGRFHLPPFIFDIINTLFIGIISAVVYFFIFSWVFPNLDAIITKYSQKITKLNNTNQATLPAPKHKITPHKKINRPSIKLRYYNQSQKLKKLVGHKNTLLQQSKQNKDRLKTQQERSQKHQLAFEYLYIIKKFSNPKFQSQTTKSQTLQNRLSQIKTQLQINTPKYPFPNTLNQNQA